MGSADVSSPIWLCRGAAPVVCAARMQRAQAEPRAGQHHQGRVREASGCWKPPPASRANPMDITVIVSFNRAGEIIGHPQDHL